MSLVVYRDAYTRDGGNIDFGNQQTNGLSAGTPTMWFPLTPRKGKSDVLGVFFKAIYVLTASGAATPVSGSDALDPVLGTGAQIDVSQSSGASGRSQSLTRQFAEFLYAATTNTSFSIAALPTFSSAGTSTVTVTWFVPIGGEAGAVRIRLPGALTASYTSNVTVAYTSITSQIVSSNFTGVCAFREEKTPSLGSGMQDILTYLPKDIAPDAAFMQGESSTTITQVLIDYSGGATGLDSTDTDALQLGAAGFAPIAGTTYTTSAGFVLTLDAQSFSAFRVNFASATVHYIGFVQVQGGDTTLPNLNAAPTQATPAVSKVGTVTASGTVAAKNTNTGGGRGILGGTGAKGGRMVYKGRNG